MIKARVTVTLKNGVLDPQGKAIEGALAALGFGGVGRPPGQGLRHRARRDRPGQRGGRAQGDVREAPRQHRDRELSDRGRIDPARRVLRAVVEARAMLATISAACHEARILADSRLLHCAGVTEVQHGEARRVQHVGGDRSTTSATGWRNADAGATCRHLYRTGLSASRGLARAGR